MTYEVIDKWLHTCKKYSATTFIIFNNETGEITQQKIIWEDLE